jgi:hypothetical protein
VIKSCDNILPGLKRHFFVGFTGCFRADFAAKFFLGCLPPVAAVFFVLAIVVVESCSVSDVGGSECDKYL